jgi:hypothetical protein
MSDVAISERARARAPREARKPVYLAFSKIEPTGNSRGCWQKIGACWRAKNGEDMFSLQITAIPLNWDGKFILALPTASGEPQLREEY